MYIVLEGEGLNWEFFSGQGVGLTGGGADSRKFFTGRGQGSVSHNSEHSFLYI